MSAAGAERMWTDRIYSLLAVVCAGGVLALVGMDIFVSRTDCLGGILAIIVYAIPVALNTMRFAMVLFPARATKNYPPPGCPRMFWVGSLWVMMQTTWDVVSRPFYFIVAWLLPRRFVRPAPTYDIRILMAQSILYCGTGCVAAGLVIDQMAGRLFTVNMCLWLPISLLVAAGALILTSFLYLRAPAVVATHDTTSLTNDPEDIEY